MSGDETKAVGRLEGQVGALNDGQKRLEASMRVLHGDIMNMGTTLVTKIDDQADRIGAIETNAASMKTKLAIIGGMAAVGVSIFLTCAKMAWGAVN